MSHGVIQQLKLAFFFSTQDSALLPLFESN